MYGHSVLKIAIPSATSWSAPASAGIRFLKCEAGCRKGKVVWETTTASITNESTDTDFRYDFEDAYNAKNVDTDYFKILSET